ncbi:NAD(P)-dependent dehydrogenase (short-subunit alcohol dehydrogenase family) [Chryseobacterium ginsenosidimutans]|uniref:SDR family NAD(P)-dependent oxidoreductase n=1 Tax=Chryseobacterium ginsenosidimutans TaxID=687846 RepID=UPI0021693E6A|nr:SDR family NAD(P)-dependent oxidoreductase [Chryseobacterium ginsenosidimutans]MCS3870347.1 NAD(P)-dependent dehydrogenase (short-subunit alcohol dehydrogenase family) [Chryseobacterium ginsenosidimutans]
MKKQTIIVTGASSGIGLEVARYFLDRGDNVVINSQTESKLEQVYNELGAGENLAMVAGNIADKAVGEALAKTALEKFGSIDVLVNNAGIYDNKPFLEVTEEYLDKFLTTNLKGTFFTTQAVIPQMIKQKDGVVINVGNTFGLSCHCTISIDCTDFEQRSNSRFDLTIGSGIWER